jgi:hypothetical protein
MFVDFVLALLLVTCQSIVGYAVVRRALPSCDVGARVGLAFLVGVVLSVAVQQATVALGVTVAYLPLLLGVAVLTSRAELASVCESQQWWAVVRAWWKGARKSRFVSSSLIYVSSVLLLLSHYWGWPLPFAVTLSALAIAVRVPSLLTRTVFALLAMAGAGWCVIATRTLMHPTWWFFDEDQSYYSILGRGISAFGFWVNPFVVGLPHSYHWLPYAWSGWLSIQVGDESFGVISLLLPTVLAIVFVALLRSVIKHLTGAVFSDFMIIPVAATTTVWITTRPLGPLDVVSPGSAVAHLFALGLFYLVLRGWTIDSSRSSLIAVLLVMGLVGSKIMVALPVLAGLAAVILVAILRQQPSAGSLIRAAYLLMATLSSVWFFYLLLPSRGVVSFQLPPQFDFMNSWGDIALASQSTRSFFGIIVATAFLSPLLVGAVTLRLAHRNGTTRSDRSVYAFTLTVCSAALFFAATTTQPSSTSFFYFSCIAMFGSVLIVSQMRRTPSRGMVLVGVAIIVLWWLSIGDDPILGLGVRSNHRKFLPFALFAAFLLAGLLTQVLQRKRRRFSITYKMQASVVIYLVLLIVLNIQNHQELVERVVPQRSRQVVAGPALTEDEISMSKWIREYTDTEAIFISYELDHRIIGSSSRRWYLIRPDWTTSRSSETRRREGLHSQLSSLTSTTSKTLGQLVYRLKLDGVDYMVIPRDKYPTSETFLSLELCVEIEGIGLFALENC